MQGSSLISAIKQCRPIAPAMIEIKPLQPLFASEITGVRPDRLPEGEELHQILGAFSDRSVLVFRGMDISDEQQLAFSRLFGELEQTKVGTPGAGGNLIFLKNFDDEGRINLPTSWQMAGA
ncbi:MAG: TauD/TfdA family dioxygenase, partial [Pseudomonadota bacterium]